ncbi:hypothetical protein [Sphingomonas oryzagri]|uniref:Uncharacterized protein n=1 Tax=Sphingomonas oryzagri TaxID=3042314 RepID=A0ABT6N230_9SPHN|nr:hypothetical protein [Sphingomonas oryzagri]MDH7639277.1 hypothetical protein [Sphingomonas oryzagri]
MPDDVRAVRLEDPNLVSVLQAVQASHERDGSYQNGFSALLVVMAMLIEREPGSHTNQHLRARCEELGRTVHLQAKLFRQQVETTGERQFDQLLSVIEQAMATIQ